MPSGAPASMRAVRARLARSLSTSFLCRVFNCFDDMLIAGATAQVSFQPMPNLVARRIGIAIDNLARSYDHPRRAIATLQTVMFPESFLHRMQLSIRGQSFDGRNIRQAARCMRRRSKSRNRYACPSVPTSRASNALTANAARPHDGDRHHSH